PNPPKGGFLSFFAYRYFVKKSGNPVTGLPDERIKVESLLIMLNI
ncbi:MAG: hypothetical protein JWQ38_651, partial [Flavipsychrobacter sp.]|nr:hypothetical protein [Flavipsychrobacter sp.]